MADANRHNRDIVVAGASAGGVEALVSFVRGLPSTLNASLFIVLHTTANSKSLLPLILARHSRLHVAHAKNDEPIRQGCIYIAPPDHHLILKKDRVTLVRGPKENMHRPSIDHLFRSAARNFGTRCIGIVLTGAMEDGAAGMAAIKKRGGVTIVQDPKEALYSSMPLSVLQRVTVDYKLPASEIGPILYQLTQQPAESEGAYPVTDDLESEFRISEQNLESEDMLEVVEKIGSVSKLTCPDCHGALWEIKDAELLRYRCHVGHGYSLESLANGQEQMLENALWSALRALEEKILLADRIISRARTNKQERLAKLYKERAARAEEQADLIRTVLLNSVKSDIAEVNQ